MSKPRKLESGKWLAQVQIDGKRQSKTFLTRSEAADWLAKQQLQGSPQQASTMTFADVCTAWLIRNANSRKSGDWEARRIAYLATDPMFSLKADKVDGKAVAEWRERRLQVVTGSTVNRDWNLLSMICATAIREMNLMRSNPFSSAKRPQEAPPRTRIPTDEEISTLMFSASNIAHILTFAIETGCRLSEITGARWEHVKGRTLLLPRTKNGSAREVPLSKKALEAMGEPGIGSVFGLTNAQVYYAWKLGVSKTPITGLRFHDLRAYAATKLSKVLNPQQLGKMFGWTDLNFLLRVYYRESAESIATLLD
jgi:integrase